MPLVSLLIALTVSAYWPSHWLGKRDSGELEVVYGITEVCEINLVEYVAYPNTLSRSEAKIVLENILVKRERDIDQEEVYSEIPGLNIGDTHSTEQYAQLLDAVEELGPWPEKRFIRINGSVVVCELAKNGEVLRASHAGSLLDAAALTSIPVGDFKIGFVLEGK